MVSFLVTKEAPHPKRQQSLKPQAQQLLKLEYKLKINTNSVTAHIIRWHSPATLTEGFPSFFLSCNAGYTSQRRGRFRTLSN